MGLNSLSTPYHRAYHAFAVITACATFLLIAVGALVTSNDAGLSVPDWPTSFGHSPISYSYFTVPMVGGVKYEHGHRMFAELIGLMVIALAIWTWRIDRRAWMRKLSLGALGIVIVQGILGGVTVLLALPAVVSTAHAALGQAFLCILVAMALASARGWLAEPDPVTHLDDRRPSLFSLAWLSVAAVYIQLILGAMFRHNGMRLLPHVICAAVVTILLVWTIVRALSEYRALDHLRRPAVLLLGLLLVQLVLGFAAYITRVMWDSTAAMVASTVAHVSVGALLLATAVVLAIRVTRYLPVLHEKAVATTQRTATA